MIPPHIPLRFRADRQEILSVAHSLVHASDLRGDEFVRSVAAATHSSAEEVAAVLQQKGKA